MEDDLLKLGFRIVAASMDRPEKLRATLQKNDLTYTLLSDAKANGVRAFGLAWVADEKTRVRMKKFGIDLEERSGETHHILPVPGVFLIDGTGVIRFRYTNPDYKTRPPTSDILREARAIVGEKPGLQPSPGE